MKGGDTFKLLPRSTAVTTLKPQHKDGQHRNQKPNK